VEANLSVVVTTYLCEERLCALRKGNGPVDLCYARDALTRSGDASGRSYADIVVVFSSLYQAGVGSAGLSPWSFDVAMEMCDGSAFFPEPTLWAFEEV
jgi:hypothetical protein